MKQDDEQNLLEGLAKLSRVKPDKELQGRLMARLIAEGLVIKRQFNLQVALKIAAVIIIGVFGFITGRQTSTSNASYNYVMLLRAEPDEISDVGKFEEYKRWATMLKDKGIHLAGEKLTQEAMVIDMSGEVTTGKIAPITGYFLFEVKTKDEMLAIARQSPHIKYGGQIEIRQIINK